MNTGFFFSSWSMYLWYAGYVLPSGNCKLSGGEGLKKLVDFVSDCVIDLVSSMSLKHYMHGHFQDLVDEKN